MHASLREGLAEASVGPNGRSEARGGDDVIAPDGLPTTAAFALNKPPILVFVAVGPAFGRHGLGSPRGGSERAPSPRC